MADSGGHASLAQYIAKMSAMIDTAPGDIAAMVANKVREDVRENLEAGRDIDGSPWALTVKDGRKAYPNYEKYYSVTPVKNSVVLSIFGPLVLAQFGTGKMVARRTLPSRGIPKKLGNAIRMGWAEMAQSFLGRKGRHDKSGRKTGSWIDK